MAVRYEVYVGYGGTWYPAELVAGVVTVDPDETVDFFDDDFFDPQYFD